MSLTTALSTARPWLACLGIAAASAYACGTGGERASTTDPEGVTGIVNPSTKSPGTPTTAAATPHGLGLRVGDTYLARRGQSVVAVPVVQLAAAVQAGWIVEFTKLASGAVAFGNLCLAAPSSSNANGVLSLGDCSGDHVVRLSAVRGGGCFYPNKVDPAAPSCSSPDVTGCPDPSAASCSLTLSGAQTNSTLLVTRTPLVSGDAGQGALLHAGSDLTRCLVDGGTTLAVVACNARDANQRWLWGPNIAGIPLTSTGSKLTVNSNDSSLSAPSTSGGIDGFADLFGGLSLASEHNRCLFASGTASAPDLTVGSCASPNALTFTVSLSALTTYIGAYSGYYFLNAGTDDATATLMPVKLAAQVADGNALSWQLGPTQ